MIRRPPRSTQSRSSAASDVYKRQPQREWACRATELCPRPRRPGAPAGRAEKPPSSKRPRSLTQSRVPRIFSAYFPATRRVASRRSMPLLRSVARYRMSLVRVEPDGAMPVSTREPLEPARVPRAREQSRRGFRSSSSLWREKLKIFGLESRVCPVSYTHLTLPTIYSV